VSNEGRLLIFSLQDLPQMSRGKGNKIMNIPSVRAAAREEMMVDVVVLAESDLLTIFSGKRHITLKFADLEHYRGERARRGLKLPRGFQKVDRLEVEYKE